MKNSSFFERSDVLSADRDAIGIILKLSMLCLGKLKCKDIAVLLLQIISERWLFKRSFNFLAVWPTYCISHLLQWIR
jgi:hypothetical protein